MQVRLLLFLPLICAGQAWAYSGGMGTLQVPYLIATPEDLIRLGHSPEDYDKHFILIADIDMSGYSFNQPPIAPGRLSVAGRLRPGRAFSGTLNGDGHVVRNLQVSGSYDLGLIGELSPSAQIHGIGVVDANIIGTGRSVGILAANNAGRISRCFSSGRVSGERTVGGLVGQNRGQVVECHSAAWVRGSVGFGGLAGNNSTGGTIANCYSTGRVEFSDTGIAPEDSGLVGSRRGDVLNSFWDVESSGVSDALGDVGLTTAQMQDINTFLQAGWDFSGESANGSAETWMMPEGGGYPVLTLFTDPGRLPMAGGSPSERCPLLLDANDVLWDASRFFQADWGTVSLARISSRWAGQPEVSSLPLGPILTVSGRIHMLDGTDLLALSTDDSLVCHAVDGERNEVPLGAPSPFTASVECWRILPRRPLPFTLQVRLGDTQTLPERLSELEFTVSALYAQPLATFDIPFEPMTAPVELVPGFSVQIEKASSQDGKCEFTIKEVFEGLDNWWHGTLDEDSSTCDDDFDRRRPDLPDTDLTYKATMIDATGNPTSNGGLTLSSSIGVGSMRTWKGSWTECSGIEVVRYTIAARPYKVLVPLTLTDIPLPRF